MILTVSLPLFSLHPVGLMPRCVCGRRAAHHHTALTLTHTHTPHVHLSHTHTASLSV